MEAKPYVDQLITILLTPAKWLYGIGVWFHNWLYDSGIRKSKKFDVPVISVGNLTVGGTGKTPHVEYLLEKLGHRYNIAVVSRGYKRKTKGYVLASPQSTPEQIGDEPYQIYRKFGGKVNVAVCNDRKQGIEKLLKTFPETEVIILDDAYQHRKIKPLISILLLDVQRPVDKDALLPLGRLREPRHATERADMIVFTKCKENISPIDFRTLSKSIQPLSFQKLFFSGIRYQEAEPVFPDNSPYILNLNNLVENDSILLVTGIAYPRAFVKYFKQYDCKVKILRFADHHNFSRKDIDLIRKAFYNMSGRRKYIITTEKDSVRLLHNPYIPYKLKPYIFYLPIKIKMYFGLDGDVLEEEVEKALSRRNID